MDNRLHAITLIYHCEICLQWYAWYVNDIQENCPKCHNKLIHTSTVDPATIISRFLNNDKDVMADCKYETENEESM